MHATIYQTRVRRDSQNRNEEWTLPSDLCNQCWGHVYVCSYATFTSQWLKTSCGLARPLVLLRNSSANPKLSATGRTALMMNMSVPSFISSCSTRPSRFPRTPYTRPGTGRGGVSGHTQYGHMIRYRPTTLKVWTSSLVCYFWGHFLQVADNEDLCSCCSSDRTPAAPFGSEALTKYNGEIHKGALHYFSLCTVDTYKRNTCNGVYGDNIKCFNILSTKMCITSYAVRCFPLGLIILIGVDGINNNETTTNRTGFACDGQFKFLH